MTLKKLTALLVGAALAGSVLAVPASAAPASGNQPTRPAVCKAEPTKISGLIAWYPGKTLITTGKKIKLSFKVTKGCDGKVKAYVGKKLVKSANFKKSKTALTIPASKFKAAKKYKLTLQYGNAKVKYEVWTTAGKLTTDTNHYVVYMNNETPWTANVTWTGPVDSSQTQFSWYQGAFTTDKGIIGAIEYGDVIKTAGTTKSVFNGTAAGWFQADSYARELNAPGIYAVNLGFLSNNYYTYPRASLEVPVTIEVLPNQMALAPGVYTWPKGEFNSCHVTVFGPDRITGDVTFYAETATGVQINPTDTGVEFGGCGGGPVKIG